MRIIKDIIIKTKRIIYENKRVLTLIWKISPIWIIVSCIVQLYEGIYPIINNYTTKMMIDAVTRSLELKSLDDSLFITLLIIISATVLLHIILAIKRYVDVVSIDKINFKINTKVMKKISEKPYFHFENPTEMDKIERVKSQGSSKCIEQFTYTSAIIFYDIIFGLSTLFIMIKISWIICVLFIVFVSLQYIVNTKLSKYNYTKDKELTTTKRKIQYLFGISVSTLFSKEVKIFRTFDWIRERYNEHCKKYNDGHKKYVKKSLPIGLSSSIASTILYVISYIIIIQKGISEQMSVGTIIFYTSSLSLFSSFLETFISHISKIYGSNLYTSDLFDLLDENYLPQSLQENIIEFNKIQLNNVSFKYPGTERMILNDICLEINSGESICLVGKNGAGKSTLIKLILGLYQPNKGEILLDKRDINENKNLLYATAVFQDYAKYGFTLKENIIFNENVSEEKIYDILNKVGISDEELNSLPDGLETFLNREYDENGINLSGGQWQKVAVARAISKSSPLIILDEPTSNMDSYTEEKIYNLILEQKSQKTIIMVSHRLSGVINADKIIVMDNGKILAIGKHSELIERCDLYKEMFNLQLNRYLKDSNN